MEVVWALGLFVVVAAVLLLGFPVAFTLVASLFGLLLLDGLLGGLILPS